MKKIEKGTVYETCELESFKVIKGNRADIERRKNKIAKSVEKVGYISAPIIVNEKMEVIDGQARLAYCKEKGISIAFYIIEGLTVDECIAMNISSTNWGIRDYIESYAERGYPSYVLAKEFIEKSPYSLNPTLWALTKTDASNSREKIMEGNLDISEEQYRRGLEIMDFWKKFDDIYTNRRTELLIALGYCYLLSDVDNATLVRKLHQRPRDFQTIANVTDAIDVIEDAYNVRTRNHVYIETEYFKFLDGKTEGFASKSILIKKARRTK